MSTKQNALKAPRELKALVETRVRENSTPPHNTRRRLLLAAASLVLSAVFFALQMRHDLRALSMVHVIVSSVGLLLLSFFGVVLATTRGRFSLGAPVTLLFLAVLLIPLVYSSIVMMAPLPDGSAMPAAHTMSEHMARAVGCLLTEFSVSFLCLCAFVWALRGSVISGARIRGAALGAAIASWSGIGLHLHCPQTTAIHLLLGHVLPILLLSLVGAWVTARVAKI